ncbi:MAG: DNA polymerase III subunit beta [Candidatus Gastranaerophilales bacterium]|nr:DNA polymerase III subunit beta [Candidatus Gastranaerophilales bacterium]
MKFSCNQQTLTKALNIVSKAVTIRTTIPILKGILLKVDENGVLTMSASDLDISIEKKVKVENSEAGEIVVLSKLFGDIIRKLPDGNITLEETNGKVNIKCSNSEFNIVGLPADEFPNINPTDSDAEELVFNKDILKEMVKKTSFSASIDENKGAMTGVLVEMDENSLNMIAIDGFRMAITRELMKNKKKQNIIIPAKILNEISRIITESDIENDDVTMLLSQKKAVFIMDGTKIVVRLLEGEFMNYKRIIPAESSTRVVLNKNDFLDSVERASLLAKVGKNNLIKLEITDNNIEITSESEEGNVKEEVIVTKEGNDLIIGFNSKYLIDVLKAVDDENVTMLFNTNVSPCLIKPVSGNYFEYLVLPVRISH